MHGIIKKIMGYIVILAITVTLAYLPNIEVNTQTGTWKDISRGITGLTIQALAIDSRNNNILYAGTQSSGIFKTIDGGASWLPVNTGLTGIDVRSIVIDPTNSNIIYAVVYGYGVFKSINAGSSWAITGSGIPANYCINPLIIDPTNPNILYVGHYT
ncbi:MAG: Xyloglucanase [candidate division WS2 bacterium]|nr:Xyloglucanase [Candidatus Lithacetigena glycinireducens]MBT9175398.1 Xyloglucanase [Candidatus Lithacetigena glycinireducens]